MRIGLLAAAFLLAITTGDASAAPECKLWAGWCGEQPGAAAVAQSPKSSTIEPFSTTPPKGKVPLDKDTLYIVDVFCKNNPDKKNYNISNFFSQTNIVTTHTIAFTSKALTSAQFPTDPEKLIAIFAVSGGQTDKKVFINEACRTSFPLAGRSNLTLAVTASRIETSEPSQVVDLIYRGIQLVNPFGPLFQALAAIKPVTTAIAGTEQPLKDILKASDTGNTTTKSFELFEGETTISTAFSITTVNIFKIESIIEQRNTVFNTKNSQSLRPIYDKIISTFEESLEDKVKKFRDTPPTADTSKSTCAGWISDMKRENLGTTDISYALSYVVLRSGLDAGLAIGCLSKDYALASRAHVALWTKYRGGPIPENEILAALPESGARIQQENFDTSKNFLKKFIHFMATAQKKFNQSSPVAPSEFKAYFAETVTVTSLTQSFDFDKKAMTPSDIVSMFAAAKIQTAGCLASGTNSGAVFLIFKPGTGDKGAFQKKDALVVSLWRNENKLIDELEIDFDVAARDRAFTANQNTCGESVVVT